MKYRKIPWRPLRLFAGMSAAMAILAGCAIVQPYVAPVGGDLAKLTISPDMRVSTTYSLTTYDEAETCSNPKMLVKNTAAVSGPQPATGVSIPAGRLASFALYTNFVTAQCHITVSFYPKTGRSYLLKASYDGGRCGLRVDDVTDSRNPSPEKSFVPRSRSNLTGRCLPIPAGLQAELTKPRLSGMDAFKDLLPPP